MIIRITRQDEGAIDPAWWRDAGKSAASGRAPHGIHLLVLDPRITHVDMFATEATEVWDWAARFEGWVKDGQTQLKRTPFDSLQSSTSAVTVDQLRVLSGGKPREA
jgi:hypothetical protein